MKNSLKKYWTLIIYPFVQNRPYLKLTVNRIHNVTKLLTFPSSINKCAVLRQINITEPFIQIYRRRQRATVTPINVPIYYYHWFKSDLDKLNLKVTFQSRLYTNARIFFFIVCIITNLFAFSHFIHIYNKNALYSSCVCVWIVWCSVASAAT